MQAVLGGGRARPWPPTRTPHLSSHPHPCNHAGQQTPGSAHPSVTADWQRRASPKSSSLARRLRRSTQQFSALTSRWHSPRAWITRTARACREQGRWWWVGGAGGGWPRLCGGSTASHAHACWCTTLCRSPTPPHQLHKVVCGGGFVHAAAVLVQEVEQVGALHQLPLQRSWVQGVVVFVVKPSKNTTCLKPFPGCAAQDLCPARTHADHSPPSQPWGLQQRSRGGAPRGGRTAGRLQRGGRWMGVRGWVG